MYIEGRVWHLAHSAAQRIIEPDSIPLGHASSRLIHGHQGVGVRGIGLHFRVLSRVEIPLPEYNVIRGGNSRLQLLLFRQQSLSGAALWPRALLCTWALP